MNESMNCLWQLVACTEICEETVSPNCNTKHQNKLVGQFKNLHPLKYHFSEHDYFGGVD